MFGDKDPSLMTMRLIYRAVVLGVLLYGQRCGPLRESTPGGSRYSIIGV